MLAAVPPELRLAPFRGAEAISAGLLTRRQLAGPTWSRLFRDVYVHTGLRVDHRTRCHAAGLHVAGRGAVSGRSAACLWGADVTRPDDPVEVTMSPDVRLRMQRGLVVVRSPLERGDLSAVAGTPVTTPVRTAFDLGRRLELTDAVVALDALLGRRFCDAGQVARFAESRSGWRGVRALGVALDLSDPGAESPMESRLRLLMLRAGLPRPVVQHGVFDANGLFVARLDLAYPRHRLGVEYDGDHHRSRAAFAHDLHRHNTLRALGWTVLRFSWVDYFRHPARITAQIRAALGG